VCQRPCTANPMHHGIMTTVDGDWLLCPRCTLHREGKGRGYDDLRRHVVAYPSWYLQTLVNLDPEYQMQLALVSIGVGFARHNMGFLGAKLRVQSLVPAAILNWSHSEAARAANVPMDFKQLLGWNVAYNPLFRWYLAVAEQPNPHKSGERYLPASTVAAFCAQAQAAAPVQQQVHEAQEHNAVAIVVPAEATTQQSANRRHLPHSRAAQHGAHLAAGLGLVHFQRRMTVRDNRRRQQHAHTTTEQGLQRPGGYNMLQHPLLRSS
jgi:hypothetical protein